MIIYVLINCMHKPQLNAWGAECWHNYGSNLTNLHFQEGAIQALKTSIYLDPNVADVWCNLGLAYYGLDRFDEAENVFGSACRWILYMHKVTLTLKHIDQYFSPR